ncbi:transport and Golgi organization protein 1 homolog [Panthera tigris]|uniref:transport and Golgi organization protein 1 homolog n=1 Tax=Panthera tigris TaxID=9694 RepID=UPI001C6F7A74|nr:transport and Golgi organization protein 1 homolog [Panthera tigris]
MAEQSREVARLKHRLDGMEGKRLLEGYRRRRPMPGSPETQNPGGEDSVDPWGPPPLTGRFCRQDSADSATPTPPPATLGKMI